MEKQKQHRQMKTGLLGYQDKVKALQAELLDRGAKQGELDEAALRAEVLGGPDVKGARETADENAGRLSVLQVEIGRSKKAIEIIVQEMKKNEPAVRAEIGAQFRPNMEKAYRVYMKTLREAALAETEIQRVQDAANQAAAAAGVSSGVSLEPSGSIRIRVVEDSMVVTAAARAKMNGYDVE